VTLNPEFCAKTNILGRISEDQARVQTSYDKTSPGTNRPALLAREHRRIHE